MSQILLSLAVLACPVGMGVMMWMMMRGGKNKTSTALGQDAEVARLRAEVDTLKAQRSQWVPRG